MNLIVHCDLIPRFDLMTMNGFTFEKVTGTFSWKGGRRGSFVPLSPTQCRHLAPKQRFQENIRKIPLQVHETFNAVFIECLNCLMLCIYRSWGFHYPSHRPSNSFNYTHLCHTQTKLTPNKNKNKNDRSHSLCGCRVFCGEIAF